MIERRVALSVLVVIPYLVLPMAWAAGAVPTGALAAFLSAPLAMRLGDAASHGGREALRGGLVLVALFAALFWLGGAILP